MAECSPKEVRGRITGLFQIMVRNRYCYCRSKSIILVQVAIGVMISYFVNCMYIDSLNKSHLLITFQDGVGIHIFNSVLIWRVPFGIQLVPAGIMAIGILTIKVSLCSSFSLSAPLISVNRNLRGGLLPSDEMKKLLRTSLISARNLPTHQLSSMRWLRSKLPF